MAEEKDDNTPAPGTFRIARPPVEGGKMTWVKRLGLDELKTTPLLEGTAYTEDFAESYVYHDYLQAKEDADRINAASSVKVIVQGKRATVVKPKG
jgi:hypothetical protein